MEIKDDFIQIASTAIDADGNKLEPEEQPARRVLITDTQAKDQHGNVLGAMDTSIVLESTAGEIAEGFRSFCSQCKHFDPDAWAKIRRAWSNPLHPEHKALNFIRSGLLQTRNAQLRDMHAGQDGDIDLEHAVALLGICHPLTEIKNDVIIVHPLSCCPDEVKGPSSPDGLFEDKSKDAEKRGSAAFDLLMRKAQGKE